MSVSLTISAPTTGQILKANVLFPVVVQTMAPPSSEGSVLGLQFSPHVNGPWVSCRPIGESGAVQATSVSWSPQDSHSVLTAVASEDCFIRAAIFADQNLETEPLSDPSSAVELSLVFLEGATVEPTPAPAPTSTPDSKNGKGNKLRR